MGKINVEQYNPEWKSEFEKAKMFYEILLKNIDVEVVHVGSTSIEGLWAKPVLDIDIIVEDLSKSQKVISQLECAGYKHIGNMGVEGREAFKNPPSNKKITWMDHHLYVCIKDNENLKNHMMLKRHLKDNNDAIQRYSELKRVLAKKFPHDIDSYIDGKTDLITEFLKAEGMDLEELSRIEAINKIE